tara:strand:- start:6186 stop:6626 length:441 start_codon:yes stop_codon:yes gene_type:complete
MKKLIYILIFSFGLTAVAQVAPTTGKKTLSVDEKFENEYSLEVFKSMYEAPYNYHMKKLPAKLAKYGFTNVTITALGSVQPVANKKGDVGLAIAKLQNGATISGAISTAVNEVDMSEFQVNFTSDQGTFKVRLSSTATKLKYIIKN